MQKHLKQFSVNDVKMYNDKIEDRDFSIVEIWAFADGNNSHRNPISNEVLHQDAETFKGKFVVAKFDKFARDVKGHETDEVIVGYVDPRETIEFKSKEVDGIQKEFVVVKALLSKIYARDVVEMFRASNERTVSCEFSCALQYDENQYGRAVDEYGVELGVDNPILGYHMHGITILGKNINPSIRGTEIKVKQFAEMINQKEEFSQEDLLNIQEQDKEDAMENEKLFSESAEADKEKDIVMEEEAETKEMAEEEVTKECAEEAKEDVEEEDKEMSEDENKEMAEDTEDTEEEQEEKEMSCENSEDKAMAEEEEKSEDDSEEKQMEEVQEDFEQKEFSEEEPTEEKSMSELAKEFAETEEDKEFIDKFFACELKDIVGEILELKKFRDAQIQQETETKLNSILAKVKGDIEEKKFAEFVEEGSKLSLSELDAFENKVKAFAYDEAKIKNFSSEEEQVLIFANTDIISVKAEMSADDIYKKYL